ncbi:uncharacterized protein I206_107672 [Kwoniella pini CBS 10737]|uniref:Uncharacterized protein n=1 Tax=Kwoniella pini CBS 10737 TaxID=1296096 RepID=A0A1B9HXX8_9TREE|nr:uncharacterized protein I206_06007 [Kwoniella pini CBS 10737]OCF48139.1 hypothetical protein I206_06007 [Kwoniella pini CBS 10737]
MTFRIALRPLRPVSRVILARPLHSTTLRLSTAGYGDPQEEKAENHTPTPSSTPDPKPAGQGKGPGSQSGTTDPEVGQGIVGNAGGKKGAGDSANENVSGQEIKETKKVGEDPKKEEVGGAGPIGG